jgi:hypothetical protein
MEALGKLKMLTDIGFKSVGTWQCSSGTLQFHLSSPDFANKKNILYAMVIGTDVKYVGKSIRTLSQRMQNYKSPHDSQRTNVRIRANILAIGEMNQVEIYALEDNGLLHFGQFHLNLAAGLEDSLIKKLCPEWNGGKKVIEAIESEVPIESTD